MCSDATRSTDSPEPTGSQGDGFDRRTVGLVSGAHFAHDCYPAFIGVLLPLLIPRLGISLAMAGLLASGVRWTTLIQPMLGHWADRTETRYWVIVAPTTTALFMSLVGVAPNTLSLFVLLLATGFSHAAFHPPAGALVTRVSGTRWGKGMSYFMTGGELGRAVGPLFIASVVAAVGLEYSWVAFFPGLVASYVLYRRIGRTHSLPLQEPPGQIREALRQGWKIVLLVGMAVGLRAVLNVGLITFYPTLATGVGASLVAAGLAVAVYEVGATVGAFLGGGLSDRIGRKAMLALSIVVGVPLCIGGILLGPGVAGLALLGFGGLALISAHPVQLVVMQELFPRNRSAAVGMIYFMTTGGAIVATIAVGALGDVVGLQTALLAAGGLALAALPFIALLPETSRGDQALGS